MALKRNYEIAGTGIEIQNAYHVITTLSVEKRANDVYTPEHLQHHPDFSAPDVEWKAGNIGHISITIWKDKESRDSGLKPIGFIGGNAIHNRLNAQSVSVGVEFDYRFLVDVTGDDNHITQAYQYLLTTEYYSGSIQI
jgi:hypothetical protein